MVQWRFALAGACGVGLIGVPAPGNIIPTLWGVDENHSRLFSIGNYQNAVNSYTDYGLLKWNNNGKAQNIRGHEVDAFTLRADGMSFMVFNDPLGPNRPPALLKFDINTSSTSRPNVATLIGTMTGLDGMDISGITFHPGTGALYAVDQTPGNAVPDRLLIVNTTTAAVTNLGPMTGLGHTVLDAEDMVFDSAGHLYVVDHAGDIMYRVNPATAAIDAIVDDDLAGGMGVGNAKFEGLAFDPVNNKLIGAEDDHTLMCEITPGNGGNIALFNWTPLGLVDPEGIAFLPIPEPCGLALLALGGLMRPRRRR